jgi:uncharacterized membrane protein
MSQERTSHLAPSLESERGVRDVNFVPLPPVQLMPEVYRVQVWDCYRWLRAGWRDMWRQPLFSMLYGALLSGAGAFILWVTYQFPYLYTAAISGFLLVAPMFGAGLYEKSRCYRLGIDPPHIAVKIAWRRNPGPLFSFGLLCILAGTLWQVISVFVIAVFYKGGGMKPIPMIIEILRNPEHNLVFAVYLGLGALFAAVIFALTVVSAPMLVDRRECRLLEALGTSINAVAENPVPMAVWAVVIMLLVFWGFISGLIGMVFVLPWLGHSSFHAYKAMVGDTPIVPTSPIALRS